MMQWLAMVQIAHFCFLFGDYAQVHEHEEPCNGNGERTLGEISLGPFDNMCHSWKFHEFAQWLFN